MDSIMDSIMVFTQNLIRIPCFFLITPTYHTNFGTVTIGTVTIITTVGSYSIHTAG